MQQGGGQHTQTNTRTFLVNLRLVLTNGRPMLKGQGSGDLVTWVVQQTSKVDEKTGLELWALKVGPGGKQDGRHHIRDVFALLTFVQLKRDQRGRPIEFAGKLGLSPITIKQNRKPGPDGQPRWRLEVWAEERGAQQGGGRMAA